MIDPQSTQTELKTSFDAMLKIGLDLYSEIPDGLKQDLSEKDTEILTLTLGQCVGKTYRTVCESTETELKKFNYDAFVLEKRIGTKLEALFMYTLYIYCHRESMKKSVPMTDEFVSGVLTGLVNLAKKKDSEYGASWCKRGGIGAWFTTVRKFDRISTQLRPRNDDIYLIMDDDNSTESIDETLLDGINYLLLILERRHALSGA
jgi:hypothetical protein